MLNILIFVAGTPEFTYIETQSNWIFFSYRHFSFPVDSFRLLYSYSITSCGHSEAPKTIIISNFAETGYKGYEGMMNLTDVKKNSVYRLQLFSEYKTIRSHPTDEIIETSVAGSL